jgi:hypothetical protein
VTDFLDEKRKEIADRLKELKPLVDEYNRLEAAAGALDGVGGAPAATTRTARGKKRGPGRPRGAASKATATARKAGRPAKRRAGRRKGSGTRAAEALALVKGQPGITIPELAAKMGIKQNYLYRVLPGLEAEKKVTKQGRGWHAKS